MANLLACIRSFTSDNLFPPAVRDLLAGGYGAGAGYLVLELLYGTLRGQGLPLPLTYWVLTLLYFTLLVALLAWLFHVLTGTLGIAPVPTALLLAGGWVFHRLHAVEFMWVLNPYAWVILGGLLLAVSARIVFRRPGPRAYWFSLVVVAVLMSPSLYRRYWRLTAGVGPGEPGPVFSSAILEHLSWLNAAWDARSMAWGGVFTVGGFVLIVLGKRLFGPLEALLASTRTWIVLLVLLTVTGPAWEITRRSPEAPSEPSSYPFAGTLPGETATAARTSLPNIILISVDTLRWDRVMGPSKLNLPHLASLARDSLVFTRTISPSSWTRPAHGSLFSGRPPIEHGAVQAHDGRLHPSVWLYPQYLERMGYRTAAWTDGGNVSKRLGFDRGYDRYREPGDPAPRLGGFIPGALDAVVGLIGSGEARLDLRRGRDRLKGRDDLRYFRDNLRRARRWLGREEAAGKPFYLFLHTYQVHDYYHLYPETFRFLSEHHPDLARHVLAGLPNPNPPRPPESSPWYRTYSILYDAGIREMDGALGEFLTFLKRKNLYDRTLVVFLSDHGEGFTPGGPVYHGNGQTHESLIRVPLMVKPPRVDPEGAVIDVPVPLTATFPLMARLGGLEFPRTPGVTDEMLRDILANRSGGTVVSGSVSNRFRKGATPVFFARGGGYKLRLDTHDGTRRFFRVREDTPAERPVARRRVPGALRDRLEKRVEAMLASLDQPDNPYRRPDGRLDPGLRRTLRGLGYVP